MLHPWPLLREEAGPHLTQMRHNMPQTKPDVWLAPIIFGSACRQASSLDGLHHHYHVCVCVCMYICNGGHVRHAVYVLLIC